MAGLDLGTASRFVQSLHRPDFNQQQQQESEEDAKPQDGPQQGDVVGRRP